MTKARTALVAAAIALLVSSTCPAQLSKMPKSALIEGLREEGMRELLLHLVETADFEDPVVRRQVKINELLLDYSQKYNRSVETGDTELQKKAKEQFKKALSEWRSMIREFPDRVTRPLWRTNFAEQLLYEHLQTIHRSAPAFVEFGVATEKQQEAFASAGTEALGHLSGAYLRLRRLNSKLPQRDDFKERFQNTGLWDRMMKQYYNLRTPFFLARAAQFVTQLEDEAGYYQNLGESESIPNQGDTPAEERERLARQAIERLGQFLGDGPDRYGIRPTALSLTGRAQIVAGEPEKALETLAKAEEETAGAKDLRHLKIRLARAKALDRTGDHAEALELLSGLRDHPQAERNLLYRVLVVDAEHRTRLRHARSGAAENRSEAIAAAYDPYMELLRELEGSNQGEALKNFIYRRWEARVAGKEDLSALPPVVVLAMGEQARMQGQRHAARAFQARQQGNTEKAKKLREKAGPKLERARRVLSDLLEREELTDDVRAKANFNLGMAQYFEDPASTEQQLEAADTMLSLAASMPGHPVAERAAKTAVGQILRPLHEGTRKEEVTEAYRRGVERLLEIAPESAEAHAQRLYYAANVLMPDDAWDRVESVLSAVPLGHRDYFLARAGMLEAMVQRLDGAEEPASLADKIYEEAQALLQMTERKRSEVSGSRARSRLDYARGRALIALAKIDARRGNADQALERLADFPERFPDQEGLIQEALERRVMALIQSERYAEAADEAQRMMARFPDRAANVTDRVLTRMEERIRELRRAANETRVADVAKQRRTEARKIAKSAVDVANALVDWATRQGFSKSEMAPYRLALGKALRIAGRIDEALQVLVPLRDRLGNNVDLLHDLAEAYFQKGKATDDDAMLIEKAAPLYDRLIGGLDTNAEGEYPDEYWNAWRRRLRINDLVQQGTDPIPLRVRQLEQIDEDLGGEPYKSELTKLKLKYSE